MDKVLWRKLTKNDMNAINGLAAPAGGGGGAKHIALGVSSRDFPINEFLGVTACRNVTIDVQSVPGLVEKGSIIFTCNPSRRNGEWIISQQHLDRYPLWTQKHGFPSDFNDEDSPDRPVIFIFRIAGEYHARFCTVSQLDTLLPRYGPAIKLSSKALLQKSYDQNSFLMASWIKLNNANLTRTSFFRPFLERHRRRYPSSAPIMENTVSACTRFAYSAAKRRGQ